MKDEWVRLALAMPFFAVYLCLEGACEGLQWLSGKTMIAFQAIYGD